MNEKWFSLPLGDLEKKLKTNAASGLSRKAARSALNFHSQRSGSLFIKKKKPTLQMLGEVVSDFSLIILLVSAFFYLFFEENAIAVSVLLTAAVAIIISFICYYRAQRALEGMQVHYMPTAKVIRGGKLYSIPYNEVVPGDVIIVEKGDVVCADARLVTSDSLKVSMRTERNKYMTLEKQSNGILPSDGNDPTKLSNVIHAGSVIEQGSARAIVYAIGRYTYLGARTGGIFPQKTDATPKALKEMKRICSKLSIISMLCVLPFCVISLIISNISNRPSLLSSVFLTALAISASSLTQLTITVCRIFHARSAKALLNAPNPVVLRSAETLDRLGDIKHVFLLDGCALTDGILHYESAFNGEGDIREAVQLTPSLSMLFEAATLYNKADANALSVGITLPSRFKTGISQFLSLGNIDSSALDIRCPIRSYSSATITDPVDRVYYSDRGIGYVFEVSQDLHLIPQCTHSIVSGIPQPLSGLGADKLRHTIQMHNSNGRRVLVFTRSTFSVTGAIGDRCFVGALVLSERTDTDAIKGLTELKKRGVNVVSFISAGKGSSTLEIPSDARLGAQAQKIDFARENKPLSYKFGEIGTYYGFDDLDICELIKFAHSKNESVAVIAFTNTYKASINEADVFISCADIDPRLGTSEQKELESTDISGEATSMSCVQTVKQEADVLIRRPSKRKRGGISALINAFFATHRVKRSLGAYFTYIMTTQLLRICIVAVPMLFNNVVPVGSSAFLDARHVAISGFIIDMIALLLFAFDNKPLTTMPYSSTIKDYFKNNKALWIATIVASVVAIICPIFFDFSGLFGNGFFIDYKEFLFCVLLWMHPVILFCIKFVTVKNAERAIRNRGYLLLCAGIVAFVILLFANASVGNLMNMQKFALEYFALTFLPPTVFVLTITIVRILSTKLKK